MDAVSLSACESLNQLEELVLVHSETLVPGTIGFHKLQVNPKSAAPSHPLRGPPPRIH